MDPSRYQLAAERLIVEPVHGQGGATVALSGVGGVYTSHAAAEDAARVARNLVVDAALDLLPSSVGAAEFFRVESATSLLVAARPAGEGRWQVHVADLPLYGTSCERIRAELADALQIAIEGDAGEEAVRARRHGPPESAASEIRFLRRRIDELTLQLAEARAQLEQPPTQRIGGAIEAAAESGARPTERA